VRASCEAVTMENEIKRLASMVDRAVDEIREQTGAITDLAAAFNANVRIADRDALEAVRRHNELRDQLGEHAKRLGELAGRISDLDHAIGISESLAELPRDVAELVDRKAQALARETTGPTPLVPQAEEEDDALPRALITIGGKAVTKSSMVTTGWLLLKIGAGLALAAGWVIHALEKMAPHVR
jgi:cell division protein ZapA (FtsZ GTPase activity inhibitor)